MFRLNDIVFAYMVCFICGLQDHQNRRHQEDDLLRRLMLFRMMGYQIGETILSELEKGKEEERVYTFATFAACDCVYGYMDEEGKYKGFFSDVVETGFNEDGFYADKACLLHAKDQIVGVDTMQPQQEITMNMNCCLTHLDMIDVFLAVSLSIAEHLKDEFEFIGDGIGCFLDNSVYGIKWKDNPLTWFDDTLRKMKENSKYHAMCHQ